MKVRINKTSFIIFTSICFLGIGCGKSVKIGDLSQVSKDPGNPDNTSTTSNPAPNCGPDDMLRWQFIQPTSVESKAVDLLFVADTSDSLKQKRPKIASQVSSFINELDSNTDYRIAVMLAHGGASSYSGRLYSAPGSDKVLSPKNLSVASIQTSLENTLRNTVTDKDEADGEMMSYSLLKSFETNRFSEIQKQGFYRENAALSVIFISDENDICFSPKMNGYTQFPDFVASYNNTEDVAYKKYCSSMLSQNSDLSDLVLSKMRSVKGNQPISLGGILYVDPASVPAGGEQAIGHGILELVKKAVNHVLVDLGSNDYSAGLAKLGNIVFNQLSLLTSFNLSGSDSIREETMLVTVDNKAVNAQYNSTNRTVEIQSNDAGQSGSVVIVSACKK